MSPSSRGSTPAARHFAGPRAGRDARAAASWSLPSGGRTAGPGPRRLVGFQRGQVVGYVIGQVQRRACCPGQYAGGRLGEQLAIGPGVRCRDPRTGPGPAGCRDGTRPRRRPRRPAACPAPPGRADPTGRHRGQPVHDPAEDRQQFLLAEVGGQQPDPAGDVEADPARGDDPAPGDVGRGDSADREPVPQCTSGIAYDAATIPGSSATLTTCSSARSAAGSGINARVANTTPGTRIRPYRGITSRYSDSATISTSVTSSRERRQVSGPA